MKLRDLGENAFVERLAERAREASPGSVELGIGDDCALLRPGPGTLVTTDLLQEDVHFRRAWGTPRQLGRKALTVNLSDIAAMGGVPRHFTLGLAAGPDDPVELLEGIVEGALELARSLAVRLVGGDTCATTGGLTLAITVLGEPGPEGRVLRRDGARTGDRIAVTGPLGDSRAGWMLLERGEAGGSPERAELVRRHLEPVARIDAGLVLAERGLATAALDLSDGLAIDLGRLAAASGVGAAVDPGRLPISPELRTVARELGRDPSDLACRGGEDYELLVTLPADRADQARYDLADLGLELTVVGEVVERAAGVRIGGHEAGEVAGFLHFQAPDRPDS